jgi:predicted transcriptional regulator
MGFSKVFDYVAGKSDWTASGLPTEGEAAHEPRAGFLARHDALLCDPDDSLTTVRDRLMKEGTGGCFVTMERGVVVGHVALQEVGNGRDSRVRDVMDPAPTSVRFDEAVPELLERMDHAGIAEMLVTDPAGRFLGVFHRGDG